MPTVWISTTSYGTAIERCIGSISPDPLDDEYGRLHVDVTVTGGFSADHSPPRAPG